MVRPPNYRQVAVQAARRHGVPPNIFLRQIQQESGFNPNARSPAGALGIAQFMPGTAKGMHVDPMNPVQALDGAARMMSNLIHKFGRVDYALAAYNAGAAAVAHYHGIPPFKETRGYVRSIMGGLGRPGEGAPSLPSLGMGPHSRVHTTRPAGVDPARARIQAALTPNPEMSQLLGKLSDSPTLQKVVEHTSQPITLPSLPTMQPRADTPQTVGRLSNTITGSKKAEINELFYDPIGGIKHGQQIGAIGDHSDHVHFAIDNPRLMVKAINQARRMGLRVSENLYVGKVNPVHVSDSNHYKVTGKVNGRRVSGAGDFSSKDPRKMAAFYRWAAKNL